MPRHNDWCSQSPRRICAPAGQAVGRFFRNNARRITSARACRKDSFYQDGFTRNSAAGTFEMAELNPPVFDFRVLGLGTQEDDRTRMLLGTKKSRSDSSTERLTVHFTSSTFSWASLYVLKFLATGFSVG
jgi:hypothetical protein